MELGECATSQGDFHTSWASVEATLGVHVEGKVAALSLNFTMEVKGNIWRIYCCIFMRLEEDFVGVYCRSFSGAAWRA